MDIENAPDTRTENRLRDGTPEVPIEQFHYAAVLEAGTVIGFFLLVAAFAAYIGGIAPAHVALDRLPDLWTLPADDYAVQARVPRGWGWVRILHRGEMLSQAAIAVLAGVSIASFGVLAVMYRRRGDRAYFVIAVLEIIVLVLAASGVVTIA